MDQNAVPDDVWLEIFAFLPPKKLVVLKRVSRHYRALAVRLLHRNVFWIHPTQTEEDLLEWNRRRGVPETLPRTVTIKLPLTIQRETRHHDGRFQTDNGHLRLYSSIRTQLPRFPSLHTLTLSGTTLGADIFLAISSLPALRTLHIDKCYFADIPRNYKDVNGMLLPPPVAPPPISSLALTHLTLGDFFGRADMQPHPITLITCPTLESLDLLMNIDMARDYEQHILQRHPHHFGHVHFGMGQAHPNSQQQWHVHLGHPLAIVQQFQLVVQPVVVPETSPRDNAPAPNLRSLKLYIPDLSNDLMPSLGHLTLPRPGNTQLAPDGVTLTALPPRVTLKVDSHSKLDVSKLSLEQTINYFQPRRYQHGVMWGYKTPVVQGVCNYTGPTDVFGCFVPVPSSYDASRIQPEVPTDTNSDGSPYFGFRGYALQDVCLIPVASSPPFQWILPSLLEMQKNASLLQHSAGTTAGLHFLEIPNRVWNSELLYAVAAVWPDIESLVIRVGTPFDDETVLITMSADIISKLKKIHTLRIIEDPTILCRDPPDPNQIMSMRMRHYTTYFVVNPHAHLMRNPDDDLSEFDLYNQCGRERLPPPKPTPRGEESISTVKDYIHSWTRECPSLRKVQVGGPVGWSRQWEGAEWERWIPEGSGV